MKRNQDDDKNQDNTKRQKSNVTQEDLDAERIAVSVKPRTFKRRFGPRIYSDADKQELINAFTWTLQKASDYHEKSTTEETKKNEEEKSQGHQSPGKKEPEKKPTRKTWRWARPDPETEQRWRHIEQNSLIWHIIRSLSFGASGLMSYMGFNSYCSLLDVWKVDMGMVIPDPPTAEKLFPCNLGHLLEPLGIRLSALLLGARIEPTGVWLHPRYSHAHASPDGLVEYPDILNPTDTDFVQLLNKYTLHDALRGLFEHKLGVRFALINKLGIENVGFPSAVRPYHVIQIQGQAACVSPHVEWTEYTSTWVFNEQTPLRPIPDTIFFYDRQKNVTNYQTEATCRQQRTGKLKFGEVLVSRVYANQQFGKVIYDKYLPRYMHCLTFNKPPKTIDHEDPGIKIKWLPLVQAIWYMDGCPGDLWEQNVFDPTPILDAAQMPPDSPRPKGWIGCYPPKKRIAIEIFYDTPPQEMTLSEFADLI